MLENNREEESVKKHVTKEINSINVPRGLKEEMWTQVKPLRKKRKTNLKAIFPYVATVACIAILVVLGLSGFPFNSERTPSDTVTNQDENIQTIEAVLQNALNGPSVELIKIIESEGLEDLAEYEESLYKDYFADDTTYQNFIMNNSTRMVIEAAKNDYKLKVKNIEYEKTESKEIIYDFAVKVEYHKEGSDSAEVEMVTGQANMNKEHKLERLLIRNGDFLRSLEE